MSAIARYLKHNALAALALFVALGGTGYAAVSIPHSSVGTRQLRNGAVTRAKLNGKQIGATIRAWAYVDANGKVLASHGVRPGVARGRNGFYGFFLTTERVSKSCSATASVGSTPTEARSPGSAVASLEVTPSPGLGVNTFNAVGQAAQLPFVVQVLC